MFNIPSIYNTNEPESLKKMKCDFSNTPVSLGLTLQEKNVLQITLF